MTGLEHQLKRASGERGDFAIFIAVIMTALLLLGSIAYDGPRLVAARQHVAHVATEVASVAATTIAAGGTLAQAEDAARVRLASEPVRHGQPIDLLQFGCVGNQVGVVVGTAYRSRTALAVFRERHTIVARGAAETVLVGPGGIPAEAGFGGLPECPLLA